MNCLPFWQHVWLQSLSANQSERKLQNTLTSGFNHAKDALKTDLGYATDGFPALYMCLCAKMWGVYRVHHEEEGKGGFLGLFHDSWDVTDGFIFAPLGNLPPGPSYDTVIPA